MPRPFRCLGPGPLLSLSTARASRVRSRTPSVSSTWRRTRSSTPGTRSRTSRTPTQFKDAVNTLRAMQVSDKIFGEGQKLPKNWLVPLAACLAAHAVILIAGLQYYYGVHMPANNPTWRKVVNKEWEEAINTSPWDHMSHVWQYSDNYAAVLGDIAAPGPRRFYIPA
ncbi:cytochrome c oxidase VII [Strigomonas culicis]|uniref:Cytochrome c oxidase VII n=1 Tax=Strigomonas culicis TaxID=28005 RepID=S9W6V2_9TRYP|nr:cytochrome c oxidase VII [Strigomonas culicis]|eukprot:EPY35006.1 cytochrome c oxidase VII [Strigomonas culicis]